MKNYLFSSILIISGFAMIFWNTDCSDRVREVNFIDKHDSLTVLRNPYKGLYHHYYDNSDDKYLGSVDDIRKVPGMDFLLIRLAWSFFEPVDNNYDWRIIDDLVDTYVPLGYRMAFAITCKETGMMYATPKWVFDAGARGLMVRCGKTMVCEPVYDDPVFLEKLNEFHSEMAKRYDGKPWLAYVQIASYGSWGEGHNWPASDSVYSNEAIMKHIDIYLNNYRLTPLTENDDVYNKSRNKAEIREYVERKGIFWSDHSIMVRGYIKDYPSTFSVKAPELFEGTWRNRPTCIELEHYRTVKNQGNWSVPEGKEKGADFLLSALRLTHPTWFGFHGDVNIWMADNPELTRYIANRVGYWYFLNSAVLPAKINSGDELILTLNWLNKGWAPAYRNFKILVKLDGRSSCIREVEESGNLKWMPGIPAEEKYSIPLPPNLERGNYTLKIALLDESGGIRNIIKLGMIKELMDKEGFLITGTLKIDD